MTSQKHPPSLPPTPSAASRNRATFIFSHPFSHEIQAQSFQAHGNETHSALSCGHSQHRCTHTALLQQDALPRAPPQLPVGAAAGEHQGMGSAPLGDMGHSTAKERPIPTDFIMPGMSLFTSVDAARKSSCL